MKENDLTKLTRWIIPGWVSMLSFYFFVLIDKVFTPENIHPMMDSISDVISRTSNYTALIITFLVAASGIPIGYIIYQGYFFLRWNSPFSKDGLIPPLLSGRMNDLKKILAEIDIKQLSSSSKWRRDWISKYQYTIDHGFQWRYIELLFTQAAQEVESENSEKISYTRYRYLHEITHTLGASIGSVYVGFFIYFGFKFLTHDIYLITNLTAFFCMIYILFSFLNKEDKSLNEESEIYNTSNPISLKPVFNFSIFRGKITFSIIYPGSLMILSLLVFHLFNNPLIYPKVAILYTVSRVTFSSLICWLWMRSKTSYSQSFRNGDILVFFVAIIISVIYRYFPVSFLQIDWALFTNLSLFLLINLVLFKNRQNAVSDMLALENYTLHRFIENGGIRNGKSNKTEIGIIFK